MLHELQQELPPVYQQEPNEWPETEANLTFSIYLFGYFGVPDSKL